MTDLKLTIPDADACLVCAATDGFVQLAAGHALEFFKLTAVYCQPVLAAILLFVITWHLSKGIRPWGSGPDIDELAQTVILGFIVGFLTTQPEPLFAFFMAIQGMALDIAALAFQAGGGGDVASGFGGLLQAMEESLKGAFMPLFTSMAEEASVFNFAIIVGLFALAVPVIIIFAQIIYAVAVPSFIFFLVSLFMYFILVALMFKATREMAVNAGRLLAASAAKIILAGAVASFCLTVLTVVGNHLATQPIAVAGPSYMIAVIFLWVLAIVVRPMFQGAEQLFTVFMSEPGGLKSAARQGMAALKRLRPI